MGSTDIPIDPRAIPSGGLLALFGPTASGKTELALALADALARAGRHAVAVSADALQVYAGLETLTGTPDAAERARLEHRLISFLEVDRSFSVAEYAALAHAEIDRLLDQGAVPIVVGGTGLYLRAALAELALRPRPPRQVRERWDARLAEAGPAALHAELAQRAPWAADTIQPADRHRIARAHALLDIGALEPTSGPNRLWTRETRHPTRLIGVLRERDELYRRIDERAARMVEAGAVDEVRRADLAGASQTARQAVGFDELLRDDLEAMQQRTRRLAKRQLTWMRKLPDVELVDAGSASAGELAARLLGSPAPRHE